jgi:hypothetical protein
VTQEWVFKKQEIGTLPFFLRLSRDLHQQFYLGKTVFRIMMKHNLRHHERREVQDVMKASVALIVQTFIIVSLNDLMVQ